jgi:biopolymer transport protein ExbD
MAAIDLGTPGARRETNRELALVPFIDVLLCLVAFLLVTAVWTQMSRVPVDAMQPGRPDCCPPQDKPKTLHLRVEDERFVLSWREGAALLQARDVPRRAVATASGDTRFPDLASALETEWRVNGMHRAPSDPKRDSAVLHTSNTLAYADLVGVMDAVRAVRRPDSNGVSNKGDTAFSVSLAVD